MYIAIDVNERTDLEEKTESSSPEVCLLTSIAIGDVETALREAGRREMGSGVERKIVMELHLCRLLLPNSTGIKINDIHCQLC